MTSPITSWRRSRWWPALPSFFSPRGRWSARSARWSAVLIVDGLHYLNYTSAKFNHDVVQLPFWALAGFAFHRALRGRRNADWLLLGLAVGLSLWAKYFVAVLAIPLALFVLIDRDARKTLGDAGSLYRHRRRARHHGAASGLAGATTISCPSPMPSTARCRRAG